MKPKVSFYSLVSLRVFGRPRVQITTWRPAILTMVSLGFPQSVQANAGQCF
jgi:hypothetical protein